MDLRAIISRPNLSISLAKSGILWSFSWLIGDYILLLENDATLYLRDDIYRGIYIGKKFPFRKFFYFFFFFFIYEIHFYRSMIIRNDSSKSRKFVNL